MVIVYITMLELNLLAFNLVWRYEAQNGILGLAEGKTQRVYNTAANGVIESRVFLQHYMERFDPLMLIRNIVFSHTVCLAVDPLHFYPG